MIAHDVICFFFLIFSSQNNCFFIACKWLVTIMETLIIFRNHCSFRWHSSKWKSSTISWWLMEQTNLIGLHQTQFILGLRNRLNLLNRLWLFVDYFTGIEFSHNFWLFDNILYPVLIVHVLFYIFSIIVFNGKLKEHYNLPYWVIHYQCTNSLGAKVVVT